MTHAFAGSLYRNLASMLDAIAHSWITSGGRASQEDVRDILANASDDDLTVDCITEWQLSQPADHHDPDSISHMGRNGCYTASDLERAFARFRADIEHDMDVEARGDDEMDAPL